MKRKARPLGNRVVVQLVAASTVTSGGIHLVKGEDKGVREGLIVAIGPEVKDIAPLDVVLVGKYAGTDVGDGHVIVDAGDVYGVLEAS